MKMSSLMLPIILGLIGFIFSTRKWILFADKLNPFVGLMIYYIIITLIILIMQKMGLVIAGIEFNSVKHTFASILIVFSFFIVVDWESCYINTVVSGSCKNMSNIYLQSEDGAIYWIWSHFFTDINVLRIMTYVITPMVLSFIGTLLITDKITLSPI